MDYPQTNRKIDTGKTLTRWPVFVDHFIYRNGHRGSWRVTADFTHQRSCICTLIQNASQRSVTGEIYSLRLFWQILYVTL
ncbi:hypothetical protein DU342_07880 [Escherichia coli]|nr:hypothetical protein [Escherichia coli]EFB2648407.1 hypothetical protein [Escherichia coli]EFO0701659.1 hypothetical protein [Escherichia coli]MHS47026.1 hypothetical protein [Escherichia coli]MLC57191.1 hypothetical protein [Escherichia coli]